MKRLFVSYARQDRALVEELVDDLSSLGNEVWFDRAVSGGQKWWDEILSNIRSTDMLLFALTSASLDSVACRREAAYAAQLLRTVVPVLLDPGVEIHLLPTHLAEVHHIDYTTPDKAAFKSLARTLLTYANPPPLPVPLPDPPKAPLSYLAALRERIDADGQLSFEAQSAIVIELRQGLRDRANASDALGLLARLRKRKDLFAAIADDIAELSAQARPDPPRQPQPEPPPPPPMPMPEPAPNTSEAWAKKVLGLFEPAARPAPSPKASPAPQDTPAASSAVMGSCPNCGVRLPIDSPDCPRCHADFGPGSAWRVLRL